MADIDKSILMAGRQFEAVKYALAHRSDGYRLTLVVQPDDVDHRIFTDLIGQRYQVVMVPIGDDEQPKVSEREVKRDRLMVSAHTLTKQPEFWNFLVHSTVTFSDITNEQEATDALRDTLGIESRSELKDNERARDLFEGMIAEFDQWRTKRI